MTRDELRTLAETLQPGTEWTLVNCDRTKGDGWLVTFMHSRGDMRSVWLAKCTSEELALQIAVARIDEVLEAPLQWPDWKPGDPPPSFELHLPWTEEETELAAKGEKLPTIMNFDVGMRLDVTMIDHERQVVTLVPKGPWS